jgi:hypothetical protein
MTTTTIVHLVFLGLLFAFALGVLGLIYLVKRWQRNRKVSEIVACPNPLARWQYAPDEWPRAVAEEFTWVKHKDKPAQVFITPAGIYITNGLDGQLIHLRGSGKFVTHASYRGTDVSPLKLRVRWKVVTRYRNAEHVEYHTEDYRIPVPRGRNEDAIRIVQFFTTQAEQNPDLVNSVTSPDSPLSIFGKEPFA